MMAAFVKYIKKILLKKIQTLSVKKKAKNISHLAPKAVKVNSKALSKRLSIINNAAYNGIELTYERYTFS